MYLITYRDGTTEPAGTYTAACNRIRAGWSDAVIGHPGDMRDSGSCTWCWADEFDAASDSSTPSIQSKNAIARIQWIDD